MTLDELLGLSSAELDKIPSATIQAFFEPYLNVTRPERQTKERVSNVVKNKASAVPFDKEKQEKLAKARAIAEQFGLKI